MIDRVQRTGDKEQSHETRERRTGGKEKRLKIGDIGWETKYKDVRTGTKDVRQRQEEGTEGTEEWVTGEKREKTYLFSDPRTKYIQNHLSPNVCL